MKLAAPDNRRALSIVRLVFVLAAVALVPLLLYGSAPSWWSERGVLIENVTPDDHAPVNQGQLRNIAKAAVAEMDSKLPGGAGDQLHGLVAGWSAGGDETNDYAPVNLGQVKTVARPFYDRLIALGVVDFYPWLSSFNPPDDFAVANIGQVKNLFAFDVPIANTFTDPFQNKLAASQRAGNLALAPGAIWSWGNRFGADSTFQSRYPRRVTGLSGVKSFAAGDDHLVALTNDGAVLTWGKNHYGQLGDGTSIDRTAPGVVPNLSGILSVKAGYAHTVALQQDGTVVAWGDNYYGQLGNGDNAASASPLQVFGLTDVRKITAGSGGSMALKHDGTVWQWGYDHYVWQTGEEVCRKTPVQVPDLINVVDIAVGYEHAVAVKADGTVWVWGSNFANQLGNGNSWEMFQETPGQVPGLANVVKVASGFDHSLALLNDGTVWAWGTNTMAQLGDGTTQRRPAPVQVQGLTDVIAIATSYNYSLAMKSDGTVWTWGFGSSGTLPDVDFNVPQQVGLGLFDMNHNGMDDRWEVEYLGGLSPVGGGGDLDGDGISNLQEYLRGTDPRDFYNGTTPVIEMVGGNNQVGEPGAVLNNPFKVRVRNASGQPLENAPVRFTVPNGSGALSATADGPQLQTVRVHADINGEAACYHVLPNAPGISTRTVASAEGSATEVTTIFRGVVKLSTPTPRPTTTPDPNNSPSPSPTASPSATPIAPYRYAIIDLGKDIYPIRINNKGWILVGMLDANGNWGYARWKGGALERLSDSGIEVGRDTFRATDMNDEGTVVGWQTRIGYLWDWLRREGENEFGTGLMWPSNSTASLKIHGPAMPNWLQDSTGTVMEANVSAVTNRHPVTNGVFVYGAAYKGEGLYLWESPILHHILNACRWTENFSGATPLSFSRSTINWTPGAPSIAWQGPMDRVTRANSSGHYLGRRITPHPGISAGGLEGGMVDGQSVTFDPVDLNEAGIVVSSAGADMVVSSSPLPQNTISGASPLAINDHTYPAPSPVPQASPAASPPPQATPIPAPQILGWAGNALAIWERQPDGQTWHPFGLEEMIPSMDGWQYLEPCDMNDTGAIIGHGWFTDPSIPGAQGEEHAFLLVPVELMVDGNRDGKMSFSDPAPHAADQTSEEKPYRFWINNDADGILDGQEIEAGSPDHADIYLKSMRDLDDFTRLWITFKGITEAVKSGRVTVQLEWKPIYGGTSWPGDAGNPAINVFSAVETNGGNKYLSHDATAKSQVSYGNTPGEYSISLGRIGRGQLLTLPQSFFATLSESQPNKFFLFEGAGEGGGQLIVTLQKNGHRIGEYPPLYLSLRDVRRMYERGKITVDAPEVPDPWENDNPQPMAWVWDPWNWPPDIDPSVEHKTILYVHGWRITYGEYLLWADTTFKRLWQLGYKGRFYSFRWPTYHGDNNGLNPVDIYKPGGTTYNPSEYRAWLSGPALANFVNGLPNVNARYVIAHSMGNVVSGSALRNNMRVTRYAMCNAAMAAMAYDGSLAPDDPGYETPDTDADPSTRQIFGLTDKFNPVATEIINFSLPQDYALGAWSFNNALFKPQKIDLPSGKFYEYRSSAPAGSKLILGEQGGEPATDLRAVTSLPEAMGYVTKSRTRAAGARQDTGGSVVSFVNMGAGGFGFGDEHSAVWIYSLQATYPFWREILTKFDIDVTNR